MICVALVNSKGGVGKTTLTAALAVRAAKDSKRVAMVDLDPQRSLAAWFTDRTGGAKGLNRNPEIYAGEKDAASAREKLEIAGTDWVFLDGPPAHLNTVRGMARVADLVVVPVKPSALDVLATVETVEICRQIGVPHFAVLNDCDGVLPREAREALTMIKIPVAATEIAHRVAHVVAMGHGKTVGELGSKGTAAAAEIDALWAEIKAAAVKAARARARGQK
jgi:chromosome partitioning protein